MPEAFRIVFITRVVEGMNVEETAEILRLKPETVKTRLHRARAMLRDIVEKKIGPVVMDAFPFAGKRCERLTEAVLKRLETGRLLAWREERLHAARFPRWQFDEHGRVLAGLEEVLEILNRDERLDAWGKILFFLQTKASLGEKRPLDLLREGNLKDVCLAAQAYVE